MVAWSVKLLEFDIKFETRGPIKSQFLADFIAEQTPTLENEVWILYVDGSSNTQGSGFGIILESPAGMSVEETLRFKFKGIINQAEYEALFAGLQISLELRAQNLQVKTYYQLVANQVGRDYHTRDEVLARYRLLVLDLKCKFQEVLVELPTASPRKVAQLMN